MPPTDHAYLSIFTDLIQAMVPNPDAVLVTESSDDRGLLLTVDVAAEDRGRVIGKGGKTVEALRTIAHVVGSKHNSRISIMIKD